MNKYQWIGILLILGTAIVYVYPDILNIQIEQKQLNFIIITMIFIGMGLLFIGEGEKSETYIESTPEKIKIEVPNKKINQSKDHQNKNQREKDATQRNSTKQT